MSQRWVDEREREWRRARAYRRDDDSRYASRWDEDRSFDPNDYPGDGGYEGGRDKVFGQDETGASYGGETDYGAYGSGRMGGPRGYRGGDERDRSGWQNPEYGGVSPAMRRGGYGRGRFQGDEGRRSGASGGSAGAGGRFYGDDAREPIYREAWAQGRGGYGEASADYDAGYSESRARYHRDGYGEPGFESYPGAYSGGLGGYDYERGYGDAGRTERTRRFEDRGRSAGDFLHRAGQRVADWFAGGGEARAYDAREDRGGRRGLGPQGYRRSDERISEDAHERLTDDAWLDATQIAVSVSGGEVTLSGTVESREAKHRAERIVEDISGVAHVQNNLRVQKPGFLRSDSTGYGDTVAEAQMRRDNGARAEPKKT